MILHKKFGIAFPAKHLADCLLLCDVFENFRSNCLQQYNIDPCYYFSAPIFHIRCFFET